jgi:hypothetical protein
MNESEDEGENENEKNENDEKYVRYEGYDDDFDEKYDDEKTFSALFMII